MKKHQILLVEDDQNFGSVLRDYLELNDYNVTLAQDGVEGLQYFKTTEPDICLLDVMMPNKDGFTLATEIRDLDAGIPLIFITAKSLKEDMLKGYQAGADDYITKPFDSELLLYKIKAILNRTGLFESTTEDKFFSIGSFKFDVEMRRLKKNGEDFKLSPKEAALLKLLCQHKNKVLSRSAALKKIWKDDNYFTGRSMDVYVAKLRKYFKEDNNIAIINIHSEGFRLVDRTEDNS